MKRLFLITVLAAPVAAVLMAARPGTEQQLVQQLNGQPSRFYQRDGGVSGIVTQFDGGAANDRGCMPLFDATAMINGTRTPITPNVLLVQPIRDVNVCVRPSANSTAWDGGCNYIPTDENYGAFFAAKVPQYVTPDGLAAQKGYICAIGDAGSLNIPIWWAQ